MINGLIAWSIRNRWAVLSLVAGLVVGGRGVWWVVIAPGAVGLVGAKRREAAGVSRRPLGELVIELGSAA